MIPCIFFDSIFVVVLNAVRKRNYGKQRLPSQSGDTAFLPGDL
jgi:hypothetical protein